MLEFLKNISVTNAESKARRAGGGAGKNPSGMAIRIFHTGAVYPSQELVEALGLEYAAKDAEDKGNGLDVIDSRQWAQVQGLERPALFIAAVPRSEGKCDLFQQVGYDNEGKAVNSVMAQGATTAGDKMKKLLKEVYGIDVSKEGKLFTDLVVVTDQPLPATPNGIVNVPKVKVRGKNEGEQTYVRRENITIYPFVPAEWLEDKGGNASANGSEVAEEANAEAATV